jgi:hypothetical protein
MEAETSAFCVRQCAFLILCCCRFQLLDEEEGVEERLGNYARW